MTRASDNRREEILTRLMVEYDEALAVDAPTKVVDESVVDFDPQLARKWDKAKTCIDLLDRARRQAAVHSPRAEPASSDRLPADHRLDIETIRRLGRFQIKRELGRGGLGIVYLAHDPELRRDIALKVPRFEAFLNDAMRRRFLREAEAAARLNHPHLVTLLEVGQEGPICYLTAEYCPGPTLAEWLRKQQRAVPVNQAAALVRDLGAAIEHAHSRGVLHRDIKPSNVLLVPRSNVADTSVADQLSDLSPKLTDFGMAKLLEETNGDTRSGAIIGTVAYMSPEQAEGRIDQLDARTDVYALGAMLYELLTGAAPYAGKTDIETLRQLIVGETIAPRRVRREVPRDLEAITLKCLAKRPADRYVTAHELVVDLQRFLDGQPTVARSLGLLERSWKWARRKPAVAALVAIACTSAAGFLAISTAYNARLTTSLTKTRELLYATDMQAGFDARHYGALSSAQERLRRHVPTGDQQDLRTFPWQLLWQFCGANQRELYNHKAKVTAVAYSPDGRWIASAELDGAIQLWDAREARIATRLQGHTDDVNELTFSPDSRFLASAGDDTVVRVWEVGMSSPPRTLSGFSDLASYGVAFSPNGALLAVACEDSNLRIWDTQSWTLTKIISGDAGPLAAVAFSPDGLRLASCSREGQARILSIASETTLATFTATAKGPESRIVSAYSHDGSVLATGGWSDRTIRFWSAETGALIDSIGPTDGFVRSLAFSPDDRLLVAGSRNGGIWIVDRTAGYTRRHRLGHTSDVRDLAFSPDGLSLVTGGSDGVVKAWDMAAIEQCETLGYTNTTVRAVAIQPNGPLFAVAQDSDSVKLFDSRTGEMLERIENVDHPKSDDSIRPEGMAFSSDGKLLAYSTKDRYEVHVYDINRRAVSVKLASKNERLAAIAFAVEDRELLTISDDSRLTRWDLAAATPRASCDMQQPEPFAIRVLERENLVVTAAKDSVRLRDPVTLTELGTLQTYPQPLRAIAVSPDESLLVAGTTTGEIPIWDLATREFKAALAGHTGRVDVLGFSPDGSTIVSCGVDLVVRLWDTRVMHEAGSMKIGVHFLSVAFSPDGNSLAAGGGRAGGGAVHIWRTPRAHDGRD